MSTTPRTIRIRLCRFEGSRELGNECRDLPAAGGRLSSAFAGADWEITAGFSPVAGQPDAVDGEVRFRVAAGTAREVAVAVEWEVTEWSRDVFVMLPAAAYSGNRYPCRSYTYPPMVHESADIGPDAPILVSDVPRLSHADGVPSRLQLLTGDLTTPAICFCNPLTREAVILLTEQGSALGNHGLPSRCAGGGRTARRPGLNGVALSCSRRRRVDGHPGY